MAARKRSDGSLLDSLPYTLAALGIAIVPHLPYLPVWVTLILIACGAARFIIEKRRLRLPGPLLRLLLAVCSFLGVLATYETISGVGPGSALLAVMAALKLLETRRRRDQFVLLFLSIFLIMSSLLREQYVWSLPFMLFGILCTMTAWMQMSLERPGRIRPALAQSARLGLLSLPLMLAMWVFFPRIATPFWAVPIDTSSGITGISDEMSPGDLSALSLSDAVAFRVRFDGRVPEPRERYWRGLVLTRFNGRTWTGNEPTYGGRNEDAIDWLGAPLSYEVTMEPTRQHWVFALDVPRRWSLADTWMGWQQQLQRTLPIDQRIVFRATSHPEFRLEPDLRPVWLDRYRRLPEDTNPQTRRLAVDMRATAVDDAGYIEAVMQMFHEQDFYYTLEPPPLGANPVDAFLFDTRRGFCEHYASAFAVMMRAAGLPARVVVGYQGGEVNPMGDYMIVRQSDAHAWNEVWLEGSGWTRFDPTSAVAPERIESGMSAARFSPSGTAWGLAASNWLTHRATLAWDMVNARWNEWVLAYGPDNQRAFMRWLGMSKPDLRSMLLTLIAILAALLAGVAGWLHLRNRAPAGDKAKQLFDRFMRRTGTCPGIGETPLAWARRAASGRPTERDAIDRVVRLYLAARYGGGGEPALEALRQAVRGYRRASRAPA